MNPFAAIAVKTIGSGAAAALLSLGIAGGLAQAASPSPNPAPAASANPTKPDPHKDRRAIRLAVLESAADVLHLTPAQVGLLFGVSGLALVVGALIREPMTRLVGFGRLLVVTSLICGLQCFLIALAGLGLGPGALVAAFVLIGLASGMFDVAQLTLRQLLTPDRLQARMNATMRTLFWGPRPLGFLRRRSSQAGF